MNLSFFTLSIASAYWVSRDLFLWDPFPDESSTFSLVYLGGGGLRITPDGPLNGSELPLQQDQSRVPAGIASRFPHLVGKACLRLHNEQLGNIPEILKGQVALLRRDITGKVVQATSIQIAGVLDDLYTYAGPLGLSWEQDGKLPVLRLWAPTARSVRLLLFPDSHSHTRPSTYPMSLDPVSGVWSIQGHPGWDGSFYLYEVEVYVANLDRVVFNRVTDPYSVSLSTNSLRSQIVDLADPRWMPADWQDHLRPTWQDPVDYVIYELHVRDFSASDETVPFEKRGTYSAFIDPDSIGMRHLRELAQAGLTHVHLLPVFDIATINEDRSTWRAPDPALLATFGPASNEQQRLVSATRSQDGYNWGYDPFHYATPEGSYAIKPDGATRLLEFRQMVQALHQAGLGVFLDVVYNHTAVSGQDPHSVLDQIVPGYYHRLNARGEVENSTCCANTASEHAMFEKLLIDSLVVWARDYKVDGFRFDLMGHLMLGSLLRARDALRSLTPEHDGVDGKALYLYGEGWDFGEAAHNARGVNASQINCAGTGIGTFNDRLRDAVRGGRPFGSPHEQGFATGLYIEPNGTDPTDHAGLKARLLYQTLWIELGLAGGLRELLVREPSGRWLPGKEVDYNGKPAGYTLSPQENILYVSAHDNETLFDAIQIKAARSAHLASRIRMHMLALSLVALGQGVPFFHAGDDLLRSKSMDRNSFDSGDWFNRLDFSGLTHNFGVGLPPAHDNQGNWEIIRPLLEDPALKPGQKQIQRCKSYLQELIRIRKSSPLFGLRTAGQIQQHLTFHNTGLGSIPGLIVMELRDEHGEIDPIYRRIVVLFNACKHCLTYSDSIFEGIPLSLHPIQSFSSDRRTRRARFLSQTGAFYLPGRTTCVFVEGKSGSS